MFELEDQFQLGNELGKGNYGIVRECRSRGKAGNELACKTIKHENLSSQADCKSLQMELKVLRATKGHPCFVQLETVHQDSKGVHILMEKCDTDLFYELTSRSKFPEAEAKDIFVQLLVAVNFLHSNGVIHRDLKLDNVLISKTGESCKPWTGHTDSASCTSGANSSSPSSLLEFDGDSLLDGSLSSGELNPDLVVDQAFWRNHQTNYGCPGTDGLLESYSPSHHVKLADFGLSQFSEDTKKLDVAGSPLYLAPELLKILITSQSRSLGVSDSYGFPVDVWSLGVILFSLLTGRFPFSGKNALDLYRSIKLSSVDSRNRQLRGVSPEAFALIQKLLDPDPVRRPSVLDVLRNPWVLPTAQMLHGGVARCALMQKELSHVEASESRWASTVGPSPVDDVLRYLEEMERNGTARRAGEEIIPSIPDFLGNGEVEAVTVRPKLQKSILSSWFGKKQKLCKKGVRTIGL